MMIKIIRILAFIVFTGSVLNAGVGDDHYQRFELKKISGDSALICLKNV